MSNQFYTIENLKFLVTMFKDFMSEKHNVNVDAIDNEGSLRKLLYDIMQTVNSDPKSQGVPIKNLNAYVMQSARDAYLKKVDSSSNRKPNVQSLSREKSVYGDRQVTKSTMIIPEMDPYVKRQLSQATPPPKEETIERMILERDRDVGIEKARLPDAVHVIKPHTEKAENADEFIKRLQELESQRGAIIEDLESKRPQTKEQEITIKSELTKLPIAAATAALIPNPGPTGVNSDIRYLQKETTSPPPIFKTVQQDNSLILSSSNRVFAPSNSASLRYKYTTVTGIQSFQSFAVAKVLIPEEENSSSSSPFLVIEINGKIKIPIFYQRSYKVPNGRGYHLLEPSADEEYPAIRSAKELYVCLFTPTGLLYSSASDNVNVTKIEYDSSRPHLVKVVCDCQQFDGNELLTGDIVILRGFALPRQQNVQQKNQDVKAIDEYFNREEGFEVVEVSNNFFYIQAPGSLNKLGKYQVNVNLINCLNNSNQNNQRTNGRVINLSHQHTIFAKYT